MTPWGYVYFGIWNLDSAIILTMDLSSLNDKQKEAVTAPLGPVLVLAGPGSGKTKTLTHRIAYIIEKKLVPPANILALTFTNKAAKEMRSRVASLLARFKNATESLTMGTFHSVCAKILRHEISALGYASDFVIFDTDDQQKVLREILEDLRIDSKRMPPSLFGALISRGKNLLQLPADLNLGLESPMREKLAEVYARYQDTLYRQNALDFDDLLLLTVKTFENFPKVLAKYQKKFSYVLVDEYQDTNAVQYRLLSLLAVHRNIFVVGDDAQSIYKFRGSDITNILNFEKDYPEGLALKLEQNYRSTKNILDAAQKVIEMNPEQKPKTLWTQNVQGEKIILTCEEDERAEAEFVARNIVKLATNQPEGGLEYEKEHDDRDDDKPKSFSILDRFIKAKKMQAQYPSSFGRALVPQLPKKHESLKEFCILYRTHAQSRALEEVMIEASIPYQIVGGLKFYERKEIKDLLAYLRLTINFRDLVSLRRVINEPPRGIGDKSYSVIRDFILNLGGREKELSTKDFRAVFAEVKIQPKAWQSAQEFFRLIEEFSDFGEKFTLPELMKLILKKTGYEKYLRDGSEKGESRWENAEELINVAHKFGNTGWREALTEFLEEVALLSELDQKDESKDAVTLMTLHSAKGLEFDNVFFVGLEEGILPHSRSLIDPEELSEEIRLAYVGLTRARKRLFLVYTHSRRVFGNVQQNQPSRILKVLPRDKVDYRGMAKEHFREEDGELEYEPT
jgi:DNA helicase-2/ATP-dependent DNA helicase PcrA